MFAFSALTLISGNHKEHMACKKLSDEVLARFTHCNGDDQSQWTRANFDPPPSLNPLTNPQQNLHRWLCRRYLPPRNILFRSDKGFCFRARVNSRTTVNSAILFWVLEITYSQDATTDINAKYVRRRGTVQGCAF